MNSRTIRTFLFASLLAALAVDGICYAQGFPGGGGHGQGRGGNRTSIGGDHPDAAKRNAGDPSLSEPALAIERELPSLRSDLLLDATQTQVWMAFERSVHDAAQVARARQRRIVDQRQAMSVGSTDLPPGAALDSLRNLIDDEKNRAELMANVATTLGTLATVLDARQAGMLNRRVVQALRDPLGTS